MAKTYLANQFVSVGGGLGRDGRQCITHLLALYPKKAFGWVIPKEEIWKDGKFNTANAGLDDQHDGADAWIDIDPNDPADWIKGYGGTIDQAIAIAKSLSKQAG